MNAYENACMEAEVVILMAQVESIATLLEADAAITKAKRGFQ